MYSIMLVHNTNTNNLFKKLQFLPEEIQRIILEYMLPRYKLYLNKKYYLQYHQFIFTQIPKNKIELYIRTMVRQDNDFVFNLLLVENYNRWLNMKKYYYKECIYGNYINFLESYAIDNKSLKCRKIIIKLFEEQGLNKNQHKKNVIRYIRWTT